MLIVISAVFLKRILSRVFSVIVTYVLRSLFYNLYEWLPKITLGSPLLSFFHPCC
jgi:hypothetical protein